MMISLLPMPLWLRCETCDTWQRSPFDWSPDQDLRDVAVMPELHALPCGHSIDPDDYCVGVTPFGASLTR